ncbi:hypothetical protein [Tenacibaculum ovolyticum]|uniref:hypothetical protein n=1 Tax=Tenacibaculum ovolyticum TaxID=104270 RepID=UPI0007EDD88C|nr:hypothetical protein [Tenacibaculum ovolyticum]
MDILKLNKILVLGLVFCTYGCIEVHEKPKGYCNKYISGGMAIGFSLSDDIEFNELNSISIKSSIKGKLYFFEKNIEYKKLIIRDTLLLSDTLFLNFRDKIYKLHSFKNGNMEVFTNGRNGEKYENCFLESMNFNGEIIKRESNLTFKITLPN